MSNTNTGKFKFRQATISAGLKNNGKQSSIDSFFAKPRVNQLPQKPAAQTVIKSLLTTSDSLNEGPLVRYESDILCTRPVASV